MMKWWYHFHSIKWNEKKSELDRSRWMNEQKQVFVSVFKWELLFCVCTHIHAYTDTYIRTYTLTHTEPFYSSSPFLLMIQHRFASIGQQWAQRWKCVAESITLNEKKYFVIIYFLTLTTMRRPYKPTNERTMNNYEIWVYQTWYGNNTLLHCYPFISSAASVVVIVIVNFVINIKARGFIVASLCTVLPSIKRNAKPISGSYFDLILMLHTHI